MRRARLALLIALVLVLAFVCWLLLRAEPEAPALMPEASRSEPPPEALPSFTASVDDSGRGDPEPAESAAATALRPPDTSTLLAGRVVFTTGEPAGADIHVLAWPAAEPMSAGQPGDPLPPSALTDSSGRFTLGGLAANTAYHVRAVGRGVYNLPVWPGTAANSGELEVEVKVARVWGVRLLVRDERGERVLTNPALRGRGPAWQQPKDSLGYFPHNSPWCELLGLSQEDLARSDPDTAVLLCLGGLTAPSPIPFGVQVAGYEKHQGAAPLGLLSEGLRDEVVRLRRLCDSFARLTVECRGSGPALAARPPRGGRGLWVEFKPRDPEDDGIGFSLSLQELPWNGASFDHIPVGAWSVRLWSAHRCLSVPFEAEPMRAFDVLPGENLLSFDVGAVGAVELELRRADGSPWERQLNVSLDKEGWFSQHATLPRAPFVIDALPVGRYTIRSTYPFAATSVGDGDSFVDVDDLHVRRVVLELDPPQAVPPR